MSRFKKEFWLFVFFVLFTMFFGWLLGWIFETSYTKSTAMTILYYVIFRVGFNFGYEDGEKKGYERGVENGISHHLRLLKDFMLSSKSEVLYKAFNAFLVFAEKESGKNVIIKPTFKFTSGDIIESKKENGIKYKIKRVGILNEIGSFDYLCECLFEGYEGKERLMQYDKVDENFKVVDHEACEV